MPTYDYRCNSCNQVTEVFARMSDPPPEACEACGAVGQLSKVLHAPAVHYKGSGFYSTDYKSKRSGSSAGTTGDGGSAGTDSAASDSGSSADSSTGSPAADSGSSSAGSTAGAATD